jgi:hypothetical protein
MLSKKSKIERHRKSRESRLLDTAAAARYSGANTKAGGRFRMNRCGSSGRLARSASEVFKIFVLHPKKTFSTASTRKRPRATIIVLAPLVHLHRSIHFAPVTLGCINMLAQMAGVNEAASDAQRRLNLMNETAPMVTGLGPAPR